MRNFFLFLSVLPLSLILCSQKPALTLADIESWPSITNEQISGDGTLVTYMISMRSITDTLVIQSTNNKWLSKIPGAANAMITADNRYVVYQKKDSAFVFDAGSRTIKMVFDHVQSFRLPVAGDGRWLAVQKNDAGKKLILHDMLNGVEKTFGQSGYYQFADDGSTLVLQCRENGDSLTTLQWIDPATGKANQLMRSCTSVGGAVFDATGEELAFITNEKIKGQEVTTLRFYKNRMDSSVVISDGVSKDFSVTPGRLKFSPNGKRIFFSLKKVVTARTPLPDLADLNLWHYNDDHLPTEQQARMNNEKNKIFTAMIDPDSKRFIQLEENYNEFIPDPTDRDADFVLINSTANFFVRWKRSSLPAFSLKNLNTGERKFLFSAADIGVTLSPTGKWVVWYDPEKKKYFSYETATGTIKEFSSKIPVALVSDYQQQRMIATAPCGLGGWLMNDSAVLVYDQYDIWKVDPEGVRAPLNLTHGYGRKNHLMFRVWNGAGSDFNPPAVEGNEILLVAFDRTSKANGFFRQSLNRATGPEKLSLDPYLYYAHPRFNLHLSRTGPITRAKNAEIYLLRRMNSDEFPNLVVTKDFKTFEQLSQVHPEQKFNWLSTELITWNQPDGKSAQGVLYKPENFDPKKKYPLIFYFYEKLSHRLHQYLDPGYSNGSMDIPWLVSNGYLVFTPDISYPPGRPGEGVLNSVVSAAKYLSALPFVDGKKLGLQGHSWGGFEVNYLVSHSRVFAAAQESSGASDFFSYYNGHYRESSAQFYFEWGQGRIGGTLWEKPELYLQNSPIFHAPDVTTPLLIMHNKDDGEVPFQQGVEWFTALRRLGKKVWMLQYDREYHAINMRKNQVDFMLRQKQFFDHYLKGAPAPKWMTDGLPAELKGIDKGY